jgi:Zn-dependent protease with chaperone function
VYVVANPVLNAVTIGMNKPTIVLNSALVGLLDEDELRFVVAHELGHALSGHAVYQTLLQRLLVLSGVLGSIPLGGLGIRVIVAALFEWSRKAELSADRAGLLATQDPQVAFRVHMKLASGGHLEDLDTTSFFAQGTQYDESGDLRESLLRLMLVERAAHPFAVVRAKELRRWVDSGAYTAILAGTYPRRDEDADADLSAAVKEAAQSYTDSFRNTSDALGRFVHETAGMMGSVKGWFDDTFRRNNEE